MERLIKEGCLRRYVREVDSGGGIWATNRQNYSRHSRPVSSKPRPTINYILGGLSDDQYQSKRQQKKLLRAATVKARVNAIQTGGGREETKPIDNPISFPPVNPNKVIVPHYDALVLTLCINGFDVQRVLVDPGSATDLLQLQAFNQMKLSSRLFNLARRIFSGFNVAKTMTLEDVMLPLQAGPVTGSCHSRVIWNQQNLYPKFLLLP